MITLRAYNEELTLVGKPNFLLNPTERPVVHTNYFLYGTLCKLVDDRPNWRFIADAFSPMGQTNVTVITGISITEDGETLGRVSVVYKGRGYKLLVTNHRLDQARARSNGYHTESPERASLVIRRNFFPDDPAARIEKATAAIASQADAAKQNLMYETTRWEGKVFSQCREFVLLHMDKYLEAYPQKRMTYDSYREAAQISDAANRISELINKHQGTVVVVHNSTYTTKCQDVITVHTDETLPFEYRQKLGLLKLVEPGQMVSTAGLRASENEYFLIAESGK
jgi:hypothetical protein